MDKKTLITILIVPLILLLYSIIFHVNILTSILSIAPIEIISFISAYLLQNLLTGVRDALIVREVSGSNIGLFYAFKSRLYANYIGFIIPGTVGGDLTRTLMYNKRGVDVLKSFSISISEAFYDVTVGSGLYIILALASLRLSLSILMLIALGNLIFWMSVVGYLKATKNGNLLENRLFTSENFSKIPGAIQLKGFYYLFKKEFTDSVLHRKVMGISLILTSLGYFVSSLPFLLILHGGIYNAFLASQTYQIATFIPIPGYSGVSELALTSILPPQRVIEVRVLEVIDAMMGIPALREIHRKDLDRLWTEIKEIEEKS